MQTTAIINSQVPPGGLVSHQSQHFDIENYQEFFSIKKLPEAPPKKLAPGVIFRIRYKSKLSINYRNLFPG